MCACTVPEQATAARTSSSGPTAPKRHRPLFLSVRLLSASSLLRLSCQMLVRRSVASHLHQILHLFNLPYVFFYEAFIRPSFFSNFYVNLYSSRAGHLTSRFVLRSPRPRVLCQLVAMRRRHHCCLPFSGMRWTVRWWIRKATRKTLMARTSKWCGAARTLRACSLGVRAHHYLCLCCVAQQSPL